jgi:hypothetical protein
MRTKTIAILAAGLILLVGVYAVANWVCRTMNELILSVDEAAAALHQIAARPPVPFGSPLRAIRFTDGTSMAFTNGSSYEGHLVSRATTSYGTACLMIEIRLAKPEQGSAQLSIPYAQIKQIVFEPKLAKPTAGR